MSIRNGTQIEVIGNHILVGEQGITLWRTQSFLPWKTYPDRLPDECPDEHPDDVYKVQLYRIGQDTFPHENVISIQAKYLKLLD